MKLSLGAVAVAGALASLSMRAAAELGTYEQRGYGTPSAETPAAGEDAPPKAATGVPEAPPDPFGVVGPYGPQLPTKRPGSGLTTKNTPFGVAGDIPGPDGVEGLGQIQGEAFRPGAGAAPRGASMRSSGLQSSPSLKAPAGLPPEESDKDPLVVMHDPKSDLPGDVADRARRDGDLLAEQLNPRGYLDGIRDDLNHFNVASPLTPKAPTRTIPGSNTDCADIASGHVFTGAADAPCDNNVRPRVFAAAITAKGA